MYPELEDQGHPESLYRQRNVLYRNLCNGAFEDVTSSAGPGRELLPSGRGVAFLDYDNDGALDIAVNNQNDPPTVLHNQVTRMNHWVTIRTKGTRSNRDGIEASISVEAGGTARLTKCAAAAATFHKAIFGSTSGWDKQAKSMYSKSAGRGALLTRWRTFLSTSS